ncbi:MAG TPA: N-acetylmuramoyl-L-alanine amidase, partial [Gemmatimonadaceae bacterium]|nr:N-acetylmuramoyl-L-alanine amidase [Gemmatimonadaceae bacterium]
MISGLLLFLQTSAVTPAMLIVRQGDAVRTVPLVATVSGSYLRADLLAVALGGSAGDGPPGRYRISLGESRLEMTEGVPFIRVDNEVVPVSLPPLRSGRTFLVPYQLAASVIPKYATGFNYDLAVAEMRIFSTAARRVVESPAVASPDTRTAAPAPSGVTVPSRARRSQKRLVVVDAGHGGPDPGMTGPIGSGPRIVEKYITLSVAQLVAQELRNAGIDVLMTRTSDTLIALSDRGRIANRNKGDLFVSVHVNATGARGPSAARERGYETYFLAEAKTEEASRVERMENEAVKFETGANAPKGDPLSFIINDMAQNEHLRESNDLAETIQNGMRRFHPGKDRGVQQANFA